MRTILCKSFPAALDELVEMLSKREFSPEEYHIVLTPDRYTLTIEQALFSDGGAIDCEVLTLSRLCKRILRSRRVLSKESGVLLTARAIERARESGGFEYYDRAVRFTDFAREAYETLLQLDSSSVLPSELTAHGATALKLRDLSRIKTEYENLKGEYSDASDRLKDLIAAAASDPLVKNSHFYLIGYKDATKLNKDVFYAIAAASRSCVFFDAEPPAPRKTLELYSAPDAASEYKNIAAMICDHIAGGGRYGDIAIVAPEPRALSRILGEYEIAFYADRQTALFDTPPLTAIYDLYRSKTDPAAIIRFCKNPFSGCDRVDAERLEIFLTEHGSDYVYGGEITDARAKRAYDMAVALSKELFGADSFSNGCKRVMERIGYEDLSAESNGGMTDPVALINSLLESLAEYGDRDFDKAAAEFFAAASVAAVKTVPSGADAVIVTAASALRMRRVKKLFVVDFNEGVLPKSMADGGLISDSEIQELGGKIEPTVREKNRRDADELKAVIQNAEYVVCSYDTSRGGRRAAFISECAENITAFDLVENARTFSESNNAPYIAKAACSLSAAKEIAARESNINVSSVRAAVKKITAMRAAKEAEAKEVAEKITGARKNERTAAKELAGETAVCSEFKPYIKLPYKTKLSVSELTHWFYCPYKRFLTDGVGLKERKRSQLEAPDFGIIMHEFMKRFLEGCAETGVYECKRTDVERIVADILGELGILTSDRNAVEREKLTDDAFDYAVVNCKTINAGAYRPTKLEYPFGGELRLGKRGIPFTGIIDRVDNSGERSRIIDYKTGRKKFDAKKCYDGRDMQLPLYAAVMRESSDVTGMFFLAFGEAYDDDAKLSGRLVRDEAVVKEYDEKTENGCSSDILPVRLKKDGTLEKRGSTLLEKEEFDALIDACIETASVAADEIDSGYIEKTPAEGACDYCPYKGLCGDKKPRFGTEEVEEGEE